MGDDFPEVLKKRPELAKFLRDLAPELRDTVCEFLREYEQLSPEQRAKVLGLGEALLEEARNELLAEAQEA